jgi:ubiquinone/menaquinone biosynthesis C-methylase UbiE
MNPRTLVRLMAPRWLWERKARFMLRRELERRGDADWFDLEFRRHAAQLTDRQFLNLYETASERMEQECLQDEDVRRIVALIPPGAKRILEAGSGNGFLAARLAGMGYDVVAVDIAKAALRRTREHASGVGAKVAVLQTVLERLPFADAAFDAVTCCHTLEHVRDFDSSLAELRRVTVRQGSVVALVPSEEPKQYDLSYHLHFFPTAAIFAQRFGVPEAVVQTWTSASQMFAGPVLAAAIPAG